MFNTKRFLTKTTVGRTNLDFAFIRSLLIIFIAVIEIWTKIPLPVAHVNNKTNSLRKITCSEVNII
jgi:hypothetical protein